MLFGPGIIWASMSIGGGELVLIPRVGSVYGMLFLWMPLLAIALKWFMVNEIGRWTVTTGRSISEGFALLPGPKKWLNWIVLIVALYLGAVHIGGLVAMIGVITQNILPFFSAFLWSMILMLSFIVISWSGKYSVLEKVMMVVTAVLVISAVAIAVKIFPGLSEIAKGFTFKVPSETPDWAVQNFKISKNPLVEILPAMAFAGAGAINSLWYSDWVLGKRLGMAKYYEMDKSSIKIEDLKNISKEDAKEVKGWYRVMFHDNLWAGNFLTIIVTAAFAINAIVVLHPMKIAPDGVKFIATLSKTYTETIGPWAWWIFMIGAWAVIYGTMATCYDGYARLINKTFQICFPDWKGYHSLSSIWRYRMWFIYGAVCNFFLVYLFKAVPVNFLRAAAWVEGTFMLPVMAFCLAYITRAILPKLFPEETGRILRANWFFTAGTVAAGVLYAVLIIMAITY